MSSKLLYILGLTYPFFMCYTLANNFFEILLNTPPQKGFSDAEIM